MAGQDLRALSPGVASGLCGVVTAVALPIAFDIGMPSDAGRPFLLFHPRLKPMAWATTPRWAEGSAESALSPPIFSRS
jgi:hypothetical protein